MRKYTNDLMDLVEDGTLDALFILREALNWMSEAEVKEFCVDNEFLPDDEEEDEDDCEFEVGDEVINGYNETGIVVSLYDDEDYPVTVQFGTGENADIQLYTKEGLFIIGGKDNLANISKSA